MSQMYRIEHLNLQNHKGSQLAYLSLIFHSLYVETPMHRSLGLKCPQHIPSLVCNGPGERQGTGPLSSNFLGVIAKREPNTDHLIRDNSKHL